MTDVKLSGPMLPPRSGGPARQAVVLLHGYGADGNDLIALGQHWAQFMPDAVFVSPNAPEVCAENAFGYQWFPLDLDRAISRVTGATKARAVLADFLEELWVQTGLGPADTLLVGFSQGAMMALHVGISLDQPLMGIVAFSGAFIPPEGFGAGEHAKPPVALIHGDLDTVVDPALSREASVLLQANGYEVSYHRSPDSGHGISPDGLAFATNFILAQLDSRADTAL